MQPLSQFFENPKTRRNLMLTSLWVVLFACLWVSQEVLLPFIIAGFLGYILNPLVTTANQKGVWGRKPPRWVAVLMVYFAFFGVLYLSSIFIGPQIAKEMVKLTETTTQLADQLTDDKIDAIAHKIETQLATQTQMVSTLPEVWGATPHEDLTTMSPTPSLRHLESC